VRLTSTAIADLMESVALFILSSRYIGFLPEHFAAQWVAGDRMRPLLEKKLGYQNPIYLTIRKTEQKPAILEAFLQELHRAHRPVEVPVKGRAKSAKPARELLPAE